MAAIKIQTQETFIPVEIGEIELQFKADDESLNTIMDAVDKFNAKAEKLEKKAKDEDLSHKEEFEITKSFVAESFDYLLGDGAFEKVYEQTPSLQSVVKYFLDIADGLQKELKARDFDTEQNEKMKKYVKEKKPKTKSK